MNKIVSYLLLGMMINIMSCSKSDPAPAPPSNSCAGVIITVTATSTPPSSPGVADGSISATASGGTGLTFSLNNGAFQSSGSFTGLSSGTYTITAKSANGCTGTTQVTVTNNTSNVCTGTPGPLFNAVKQVMLVFCATSGCHAGANPQNGLDLSNNCTIVMNSGRIKARAVDGNPSFMPPPPLPQLSATDKQKIVNWVNAGGQLTN